MVDKGVLIGVLAHVTRVGACGHGIDEARKAQSIEDLIALLKTPKGVEHCMESRFPRKLMIETHLADLAAANVFFEGEYSVSNPRMVIAFGGVVNVEVSGFEVCEVYATGGAVVNVLAKDNAYVVVELHHGAACVIESIDRSTVKEYRR